MATMIFVDQENGDLATNISAKDRVKLSKFSKSLSTKGQTSYPGKVFSTSKAVPKPSRKALGNVNQQVENQKVVTTLKGDLKGHLPAAQKTSEVVCSVKAPKDSYPEIENFSPYNPSDFENFEVPEDHKLSHLCLAGVQLMVLENERARFDALMNRHPAPMDILPHSWESDSLPSFLATLDEITLDMPPIEEY
ncbi:securin isoform X2 [Ascaphus truei]